MLLDTGYLGINDLAKKKANQYGLPFNNLIKN